jgi:hypothetical protein
MPALQNPRHERFARAFMKTGVGARAYLKAGYEPTTRNALDVNASRLLRHSKVKRRITELKNQMADRNRVTVDSLLRDLADDRALARQLGQASAAIQAVQLSARLVGLLIDRKESGAPGDFAGLESKEQVLALVKAELGEDVAATLGAALERREGVAEALPDLEPTRDPAESLN